MRSSFCFGVAALALSLGAIEAADAAVINLPLSVSGQATTANTDETGFFVNSPADPVYMEFNQTPVNGVGELQAIMEFSLAALPAGSTIQSAQLTFYVQLREETTGPGGTTYSNFSLFGYAGNNQANVSDAGSSGKLHIAGPYTAQFTGPDTITLDVADIQTIVNQGPAALGILGWAGSNLTTGLATSGANAPFVTLTYTPVPEPTALGLAGVAGLGLLARRRRR